jgi:hypothetical protein
METALIIQNIQQIILNAAVTAVPCLISFGSLRHFGPPAISPRLFPITFCRKSIYSWFALSIQEYGFEFPEFGISCPTGNTGRKDIPGPLRFRHSIDRNKQIHLYSVMDSPFSMIHPSRFIQLWKTLWTSSNVKSFQAIVITSSISSCNWNSW